MCIINIITYHKPNLICCVLTDDLSFSITEFITQQDVSYLVTFNP